MPKLITCFKWVVDEADLRVDPGSRKLVFDRVGYKISDYDRNTIEEAVRLKEQHGGTVTAITVGTPNAKKSLKDVLSRGPDTACFVNDQGFGDLEPSQTAAILAEVIASRLEYDLIICGEGSSDLYAQQVGPRLAEKLGISCVTYANQVSLVDGRLVAERKLDDGVEVVAAKLPALVTVLPDINSPRIPGLKQTLEAGKKPVMEVTAKDLTGEYPARLETVERKAAVIERGGVKLGADKAELKKLVGLLQKDGVIS
ncbi:MAG: electron transfer flavoprotein subunit beta/FixA family protein [Firmicutes bacterium]|nr:electron transfer flavoprotein subunit beta/FixA family protein [Bacillota bacterium]